MAEQFINPENYGGKNGDVDSFKFLVNKLVDKIVFLSTNDHHESFTIYNNAAPELLQKAMPVGFLPNTRIAYYNGINSLYDILYPYLGKTLKEKITKIDKGIETIEDNTKINNKIKNRNIDKLYKVKFRLLNEFISLQGLLNENQDFDD